MDARLDWKGATIHVVSLGIEADSLSPKARSALQAAQLLIGAAAHLAQFRELDAPKIPYPSPMSALPALLSAHAQQRIVILASGDALFYGIGKVLLRILAPQHLVFHPNVSSIQAACARFGKSWQDAQCISLHGRPLATLRAALHSNRLYGILTDAHNSPKAIAQLLIEVGLSASKLWVAEALGLPEERCRAFSAAVLAEAENDFDALNVVIVETSGAGGYLPEFPGIPDHWFSTGEEGGKGLLSKREIRLNILSLLSPRATEIAWDIGAGCGGVAVEWARWNRYSTVYAVECHRERLQHLARNRERFGVVENLHIIAGRAPQALQDLPAPHAVFIGGSSGDLGALLAAVWERLLPAGRLVVSAVTEESRVALHHFAAQRDALWSELSVARAETLAGQRIMRPHLPVLLMKVEKSA